MKPLHQLSAAQALPLLHDGTITAEALVRACLDRIAADEPRVLAWQFLDPAHALEQARRIDRASPRPLLAGVPVAVKDVIDTADMPTEYGSATRRGHRPGSDAACVAALRANGAVILGKTVTTEFAAYAPGKTRNPHDPTRTPGGSSSGSAAAVADEMVPVALGTQTAGSVIRPAAFCGVLGFKPTYGLIPTEGVYPLSASLDTLGLFARDLGDFPLVMRALGVDLAAPPIAAAPRVGVCRTEQWHGAAPETRRLVEAAASTLAKAGARVSDVELPPDFTGLADAQTTIMAFEAARVHGHDPNAALLSEKLRELVATGAAVDPEEYRALLRRAESCRAGFPRLFEHCDVLLTPSTPGEAPPGLASTGDPAFNRIWTLLHAPCIHLPVAKGPAGMPLGLQIVGPARSDGALVAWASWLADRLRR